MKEISFEFSLQDVLWNKELWSDGCFVRTVGESVTTEVIQRYTMGVDPLVGHQLVYKQTTGSLSCLLVHLIPVQNLGKAVFWPYDISVHRINIKANVGSEKMILHQGLIG